MTDLLAGTATVLALIAIGSVISLARLIGETARPTPPPPVPVPMPDGPVPAATTMDLSGHSRDASGPGRRLLLFVLDGCEPCEQLLDRLRSLWPALTTDADLHVAVNGSREAAAKMARAYLLPQDRVLVDSDGALARTFSVPIFPFAMLVQGPDIVFARPVSTPADLIALADTRRVPDPA